MADSTNDMDPLFWLNTLSETLSEIRDRLHLSGLQQPMNVTEMTAFITAFVEIGAEAHDILHDGLERMDALDGNTAATTYMQATHTMAAFTKLLIVAREELKQANKEANSD